MDSVEATAVMVEDIPLPGRGAETSVAAVHFQPADSTAVCVQAGRTMTVGAITVVADTTVAGDITAPGLDLVLVSMRLTAMLLAFVIQEGSTTSTAFGGSIPVAQFRMAIEDLLYGGPSRSGPRVAKNQYLLSR